MKEKTTQLWIPIYVDKWIFGSTRIELEAAERAVFLDLMVLSAKDGGFIRANETMGYLPRQLSGLLNITEEMLKSTIDKCIKYGKLEETSPGIYKLVNWENYQLCPRTVSRMTDKETGELIDEKKYVESICRYLGSIGAEFKKDLCCESGRIDIFVNSPRKLIIEAKGSWYAETVRSGIRQLLEYGIEFPDALMCLALPIEQKNDINGPTNEKLKKYKINLLTYSNFPSQLDGIFRQMDTIGKERIGKDKREEKRTAHAFQRPTLDQVREYCRERGNSVNPERWMSHYESNGWRVGRNPMKDWKAAVRTWEGSNFEREGASSASKPPTTYKFLSPEESK